MVVMGIKTASVILAIGVFGGLSLSGTGVRDPRAPACEPAASDDTAGCSPEEILASLRGDAGAAAAFNTLVAALDAAFGTGPGQYGVDDVLNDLQRVTNSGAVTAVIE